MAANPLISGLTGSWAGLELTIDDYPTTEHFPAFTRRFILLSAGKDSLNPYEVQPLWTASYTLAAPQVTLDESTMRPWQGLRDSTIVVSHLVRVAGTWHGAPKVGLWCESYGEVVFQTGDNVWAAKAVEFPKDAHLRFENEPLVCDVLTDPHTGTLVCDMIGGGGNGVWTLVVQAQPDRVSLSVGVPVATGWR